MLAAFADIHWIAVIAGTLVFTVLGGLYFMVLVPKQYLYVTGRENLPKEKQAVSGSIFIVGPMLCSLVVVIADAYLIAVVGIVSVADATLLGLIVGLGFLVPMTFNIAINPLFPRPIQYGLLNAPYFLSANLIACILIVTIPF
ncbi:DUF1761 domain-containing protein [Aliirhizobium terrae]|uniref:DUF1761 domain-containing protein n=1 Tax=Terrirhizobium terrae TaxID=2926709 RepID=UPI002574B2A8|nr:DUF1761 domain-containing protein [Rhizobium sp. CC-CFT758]WJH39389.1 DUF1761 domain-containing protein [Rhizobium sp. CC-CFT758]